MRKISYQIPAEKLRRVIKLKSKNTTETRCSSPYNIIKRYNEIKENLTNFEIDQFKTFLLTEDEDLMIDHLTKNMED